MIELVAPAPGSEVDPAAVQLELSVTAPPDHLVTLTVWGHPVEAQVDYTFVALPDTQFYARDHPDIFEAQTAWVAEQAEASNIRAVFHLGDVVQGGDADPAQWVVAASAMNHLEAPLPGRPDGLPYGITVGNHDQSPEGDPAGATAAYNAHFGVEHFSGRAYYGGHYGQDNDNSFIRFDAGAQRFLAIFVEYGRAQDYALFDWVEGLLLAHPLHTAIVVTHALLAGGPAGQGIFSGQGYDLYAALRDQPGLALMLGGHYLGETHRTDWYAGRPVHSLMADYQDRERGGDGWLRLLHFSPARRELHVRTYSPTLRRFEDDADSDFGLPWAPPATDSEALATMSLLGSGAPESVVVQWPGLLPGGRYEFYASVVSCGRSVTSASRSFTVR